MVAVEDFSRLISGIYAAAVTPQHWEAALREIQHTLEGTSAGLLMHDGAAGYPLGSTLPAEAAESYAEHYWRLDHVIAAVNEGPVGAVRTGTELMHLVRNSEFCEEWLRPLDVDDGLFVRLTVGPRTTCFVVGAPKRTESFDAFERVKLMSGLVPHLQQALRTQNELESFAHSSADLAAALETVRHGIIIVGSGWWAINLNTAAERILSAEDGLQMRSGRIAATSTQADHKLHRALHAAFTETSCKVRAGRSLSCERPSGRRPYVIHVLPLHRAATDEMPDGPTALVLIIDPAQEPEPAAPLLRRLYGITATEAEVAVRIARGAEPKEIADELGVSITTVRKHLQHIFEKTDTHRQAHLVRLLLTLGP